MTDWMDLCEPLVQRFEGCRLAAYQDSVGVWTIGWGSTGRNVRAGLVWTQSQADDDLTRRLRYEFGAGVIKLLRCKYTPQQLAAMVSLAYNIGLSAFAGSTLLRMFNAGDIAGAQTQFARWTRAGGKILNGLVSRRAAEAALFAST